jgi:hypothetical protein
MHDPDVLKQLERQSNQILQLNATVAALIALLVERHELDKKHLEARINVIYAQLTTPRSALPIKFEPPSDEDPFAPPPEETLDDVIVKCVRCGASVPASQTTITERGPACGRCR